MSFAVDIFRFFRNCPKSIVNVNYQYYIIFFASERSCRLIVIPEKDVQDFRKRRLTYAKPKWTLFFQEKPMQNLSGRDFFKKKRYG